MIANDNTSPTHQPAARDRVLVLTALCAKAHRPVPDMGRPLVAYEVEAMISNLKKEAEIAERPSYEAIGFLASMLKKAGHPITRAELKKWDRKKFDTVFTETRNLLHSRGISA